MTYYRVYVLDIRDKHIIDVHDFYAGGDSAAIKKVEASGLEVSRELWNRERKVMEFRP